MKKKIVSLCLVVALAATAVIGGTLAYFTDTQEATNTITTGDVSIALYESQWHRGATNGSYLHMSNQPDTVQDEDIIKDNNETYYPYLEDAKLMPFDLKHRDQAMFEECTVAKNAYVKNTGNTNDCFVRVRYMVPAAIAEYLDIFYVDTQFITADDEVATANARTLNNDDNTEPMITAMKSSGANFVAQGAVLDDAGEYYVAEFIYAERLEPSEMTLYSPISKITMVPTVDNKIAEKIVDINGQFTIKVEADAIQADGFLNAVEAFDAFDGAKANN